MHDLSELENALNKVGKMYPNKADKFMKKALKILREKAKKRTPKGTKKYFYYKGKKTEITSSKRMRNRWRIGKIKKKGTTFIGELKNKAPHAHLVEDGHKTVNGGFVPGQHILKISLKELDEEMPEIIEDMLDEIFREL